jgi:hypothetical protein
MRSSTDTWERRPPLAWRSIVRVLRHEDRSTAHMRGPLVFALRRKPTTRPWHARDELGVRGPGAPKEEPSKLFHPMSSATSIARCAANISVGAAEIGGHPKPTRRVVAMRRAERTQLLGGCVLREASMHAARTPTCSNSLATVPTTSRRRIPLQLCGRGPSLGYGEQLQNGSATGRDTRNRHVLRIAVRMTRYLS